MELFRVNRKIPQVDNKLFEALSRIPAAVISDAMGNLNTMDSGIHAMVSGCKIHGGACTAATRCGDFLPILKALSVARKGDVLVIDNQGKSDTALWGYICSLEAVNRGLSGIVIDGLVRDIEDIRKLKFPVFARGTTPRVAGRNSLGEVNVPIQCGGVVVYPGDMIVGDSDGVVVVLNEKIEEVLNISLRILTYEEDLIQKVKENKSQVDIFDLDNQFESLRRSHGRINISKEKK